MEAPERVRLPEGAAAVLDRHARTDAPREACGVLIGRVADGLCDVFELIPGRNRATSADRYELDPEDFVAADARATGRAMEVVGFYHAHPRGPDRLSRIDQDQAWPGYVYLLVCPEIGSGSVVSAWLQPAAGAAFFRLTIIS